MRQRLPLPAIPVLLLALLPLAFGQEAQKQEISKHQRPFISNVDVVLIPVTVTDPLTRFVTGLTKKDFEVLEDDARQELEYFYTQDTPISVGLILDLSGSMSNAIDSSNIAMEEFMRTANPQDEFFLITFASKPELVKDFTHRDDEITSQLLYAKTGGRTALLDAIYLGLNKMRQAKHARRALLVLSDGSENQSRYSPKELLRTVREANVQVYTLGIYGTDYSPGVMRSITESSGGRMYEGFGWSDTASKISIELRNQYVIGYRSTNKTHDGRWRKVKVSLKIPKGLPPLNVYAKTGYLAPQD